VPAAGNVKDKEFNKHSPITSGISTANQIICVPKLSYFYLQISPLIIFIVIKANIAKSVETIFWIMATCCVLFE